MFPPSDFEKYRVSIEILKCKFSLISKHTDNKKYEFSIKTDAFLNYIFALFTLKCKNLFLINLLNFQACVVLEKK